MADFSIFFDVENGITLDGGLGVFSGSADPSVGGEDAPLGSLYIRDNGQLYQKVGVLTTDWIRFSQGLGEAVKITALDTTSGYLNAKLQVSSSLVKSVQNQGGDENILLDLSNVGTAGSYRTVVTDAKGRVISGTNPTTLSGYGITDAQPLAANLTAMSPLTGTGFYVRASAGGTHALRSIVGTTNQINVLTGDGSSGNPTLSLSTTIQFPGTTGIRPPSGTTAQRVNTASYLRYNTTTNRMEYFNGTVWVELIASTGGTVTSIGAIAPPAGLTISGSPITTSGNLTFALSNDLAAVEGLADTGLAVRTAADTWTTRSIIGTPDRITLTNGDGIAGNIGVDIAPTYAGQTSITTVGAIQNGTWQGDVISTAFGGTGRSTIGTANQLLGVNTTGSALEYKTIANTTGIGLAFNAGQITISNTGVTSLTGTLNRISVSQSTGGVILNLPQDIHSGASPSFAQVTVAADPTSALQVATKQYVDNLISGLNPKQSVRVATTADITLSGLQTVDGVALNDGNRVLVKDQTNAALNGLFTASSGAWTRAADMDSWTEVPGCFVFVEEGTTQAESAWLSTSDQGGTLGTTPINWVRFASAADIAAGTGLQKVGNILSIANTGVSAGTYNNVTVNAQGQVLSGSNVSYLTGNQTITLQGDVAGSGATLINTTLSNTGVAAGTYRSVTVDAKGRVTGATNPTTLAGYGITDAQPLDGDLTSLAALTTTGILVRSSPNVITTRTLEAASSRISIANADGIANNPSLDVVEANLVLNNIGGTLGTAKGGTGLVSVGTANQILGVNVAGNGLEYKTITAGTGISISPTAGTLTISALNNGTVTSVGITGSTGLGVTGSPITSSGTIALTLGAELQGLSQLSSNGIPVRTAAGTYASRSVVSGVGTITVTNPAGTAGNIGLDLTTVGTAGTYRSVTTDAFGRVTSGTNPTTLAGYGITDAIPLSQRGAANGVASLDASGLIPVSQLPAIAINNTFTVSSEAAMLALVAQTGDMAIRTDLGRTFVLSAEPATTLGNWLQLLDGPSGTVTSVNITAPAAGITVSGGPITTSGSITLALANDLAAVENLATNGIAVRTGTSTWATRSLTAGTGITITNADGVAGNPTISATNNGTVTSVALTAPSIFSVTGSPITTSGTIGLALNTVPSNTVFAGSLTAGQTVTPTFRTLGLAQGDLNDVTITNAQTFQVLSYNGTRWVNTGAVGSNAAGLVGVGQAGAAAWSLISGNRYQADFAHNLGTTNVVITVFDSTSNQVVIPNLVTLVNNNTVRIEVVGNTRTLRVVVVANGQSIVAGGSTPSSVIVAKDGVDVVTATRLNVVGQATSVTSTGGGTAQISVGSRFSYFASSLDTPNNSDWVVNAISPVTTDPSFASLTVRSFSNTVEQGVGFTVSIPPGATALTLKIRGRAQAAQGTAQVVQPRLYHRLLPNNAAVGAWSVAQELPNISVPANAFFQYYQQTIPLAALGLTADRLYQFELTRRVVGVTGTNLATNFLVAEITAEFA